MNALPPRIVDLERVGGLGLLLDRVNERLLRDFSQAIAPLGIRHLHLAVLSTVQRFGPRSQAQIGGYLGIERQTMANVTDDLERWGHIAREPDPDDRRKWSVTLTPSGKQVIAKARTIGQRHEEETFGELSADDQHTLDRILRQLVRTSTTEQLFAPPEP